MANHSSNEAQIRALITGWAKAVRDKDLGGILARHTTDILMFDVVMPFQSRGMEGYRKAWELFCKYSPGGEGSFELNELEIAAGDQAAYATATIQVFKESVRLTLGMKKVDGEWLIAHEHHSAPFEQPG
jgi:ketosteroid isomerase-like protein